MKFGALASSILCLAASQLVTAETSTSTLTNTITKTLVRVSTVTSAGDEPASTTIHSSVIPASATAPFRSGFVSSTPLHSASASSTSTASTSSSASGTPHSGAGRTGDSGMPAALVAGSLALVLGYW
ncbi:uncharacterized protein ATNIH1004_005931 [Aspergillus tanneri]|uniref:Uncharacterized protein n=1 Tax=Aspergillus tanneri TaxID=1220188 RepID=A0A5M9MJQ9_9EURO|nr:uncharacterized protein ATNIH1004_005931 [Aspergillus tanneri]KAA8647241.1 hypothetical protein ATNIH1004_005931 [Aspergillus tanneri]